MSTTELPQSTAPAPEIRRGGTKPTPARKLFVNIAVSDLQRSIRFFEDLGFTFNRQFTEAGGTCMLVGEDAYVMLLTRERFAGFTTRPMTEPHGALQALFSFNASSREEVDRLVETAVANGATAGTDKQDHGFMYEWSFYDLDGHGWGVFWMDPSAVQE